MPLAHLSLAALDNKCCVMCQEPQQFKLLCTHSAQERAALLDTAALPQQLCPDTCPVTGARGSVSGAPENDLAFHATACDGLFGARLLLISAFGICCVPQKVLLAVPSCQGEEGSIQHH